MSKLNQIDQAAENKGGFLVTAWQFVKFLVVSLLATLVQFSLLNILKHIPAIYELSDTAVNWFVFNYPVELDEAGAVIFGGMGNFIAFNVSNITAQIVAFFVNKEKTFNSDTNVAVTLPIYIVFTIALIAFSAWLNPTIYNWVIGFASEDIALNAATMVCSSLQFFLYFPVDKILMKPRKKEETPAEAKAE